MKIDYESPHLSLSITEYYGTMEDGREFTIFYHQNYGSSWIDEISHEDDFTDEELKMIEDEFMNEIQYS